MLPPFLQVHSIHSYPSSLLNRDEAGEPKQMTYGGTTRARISSQCLKRTWRDRFDALEALEEVPRSIRSRHIFEVAIKQKLEGIETTPGEVVDHLLEHLLKEVLNTSFKQDLQTAQVLNLGEPEVRFLRDLAVKALAALKDHAFLGTEGKLKKEDKKAIHTAVKTVVKEHKADAKALVLGMGLDSALFGRMTTGDVMSRVDSSVHVAHAFGVHVKRVDSDYMSALDELDTFLENQTGSAHLVDVSLSSNVFYQYSVIDVARLVSNLEGCSRKDWRKADHTLANVVIRELLMLIATSVPESKITSMAHYGYARLMLVECGEEQPRSLAHAFHQAVPAQAGMEGIHDALAREIKGLNRMYGSNVTRLVASQDELSEPLSEALELRPIPLNTLIARLVEDA